MARLQNWAAGAVLALLVVAGVAATRSAAQSPKLPFGAGEKLRYAVSWRSVPAGRAELLLTRDENSQARWKVTARASSTGYVSNIYKVDDEYISIFRNPTLCSSEIRKTINEGDRHRSLTLLFDQRRKLAILTDREVGGSAPPRQAQSVIPDCVHDILSVIYFVRSRPLTVGQPIDVPVNDGARTVTLHLEVDAREEVKTAIGTFQTIRVEPDLFSGNLYKGKGRMFVWFTDDANHVPVQMRAQIGVGTITASLIGVERAEGNP
ncbi:MAG: DUF3108 domain-containing protein [Acidobacteria bacterium]|nr:DUF3108 domain-containing protein [Acidobacteriota bacterium]